MAADLTVPVTVKPITAVGRNELKIRAVLSVLSKIDGKIKICLEPMYDHDGNKRGTKQDLSTYKEQPRIDSRSVYRLSRGPEHS